MDLQAESTLHSETSESLSLLKEDHQVLWDGAELFITPMRPGGRSPQTHLVQAFQAALMHCKEARKGK